MTSIFTVAGARISRLANNIYLSKSAYVLVKPPTLALNSSPISLLSSLSKQKSDTTEFGTIELPIDEKVDIGKNLQYLLTLLYYLQLQEKCNA